MNCALCFYLNITARLKLVEFLASISTCYFKINPRQHACYFEIQPIS